MDAAERATIAANFKLLRERAGMTQELFAREIAAEPVEVSRWENGHFVPVALRLFKIGKRFGVGADWFFEDHTGEPLVPDLEAD